MLTRLRTYASFVRISHTVFALPFALVGGFWLLFALGHHLSVAGAVGFIALAGVSAEFGVIMLLYLRHAWDARLAGGDAPGVAQLEDAIRERAVLRVRPKAMTVAVIIAASSGRPCRDRNVAEECRSGDRRSVHLPQPNVAARVAQDDVEIAVAVEIARRLERPLVLDREGGDEGRGRDRRAVHAP